MKCSNLLFAAVVLSAPLASAVAGTPHVPAPHITQTYERVYSDAHMKSKAGKGQVLKSLKITLGNSDGEGGTPPIWILLQGMTANGKTVSGDGYCAETLAADGSLDCELIDSIGKLKLTAVADAKCKDREGKLLNGCIGMKLVGPEPLKLYTQGGVNQMVSIPANSANSPYIVAYTGSESNERTVLNCYPTPDEQYTSEFSSLDVTIGEFEESSGLATFKLKVLEGESMNVKETYSTRADSVNTLNDLELLLDGVEFEMTLKNEAGTEATIRVLKDASTIRFKNRPDTQKIICEFQSRTQSEPQVF